LNSRSASPTAPVLTRGDFAANVTSFARSTRAANLTPATQWTYLASLDRLQILEERGMPATWPRFRREHLEVFMEDQLAAGDSHKPTCFRPYVRA
jgi:hypothetical protein